jgi:hypothetical protein
MPRKLTRKARFALWFAGWRGSRCIDAERVTRVYASHVAQPNDSILRFLQQFGWLSIRTAGMRPKSRWLDVPRRWYLYGLGIQPFATATPVLNPVGAFNDLGTDCVHALCAAAKKPLFPVGTFRRRNDALLVDASMRFYVAFHNHTLYRLDVDWFITLNAFVDGGLDRILTLPRTGNLIAS